MKSHLTLALATGSLLSACGSLPTVTVPQQPVESSASAAPAAAPFVHVSRQESGAQAGMTLEQLAFWNDPEFKRQFQESYLAETDIEPRLTLLEQEAMTEVIELLGEDKRDRAVEKLLRESDPEASAVFDFQLGNLYLEREQVEEAYAAYRTAVEKYPKFRRAWKNLAAVEAMRGDYAAASKALARMIELGGGDAYNYGLLGDTQMAQANFLSAETAYRMAILLDPEPMRYKQGLVQALNQQQRFAESATLAQELVSQFPDNGTLWTSLGNSYLGLQKLDEAVQNFEFAKALGGASWNISAILGDIYATQGLWDLSVDNWSEALAETSEMGFDRPLKVTRVLSRNGALEESQRLAERIEATFMTEMSTEQSTQLLHQRARIAVARGEGGEQLALLEEVVRLDPLDGEALILIGRNAEEEGDLQNAIFHYQQAAAIEGHEVDAKLAHAQALVRDRRYSEAIPLIKEVLEIEPRDYIQRFLENVEKSAKATR